MGDGELRYWYASLPFQTNILPPFLAGSAIIYQSSPRLKKETHDKVKN